MSTEVSRSAHSRPVNIDITPRYPAGKTIVASIKCKPKNCAHACWSHFWFWKIVCQCIFSTFADLYRWSLWSSIYGFYTCLVHANFTIHTTGSPLPSPPTHAWLISLSPHPRRPSPHYLPSSHIFLSLLLLKRKWWRLYFRDHDKLIQTNRSSGHCTRIFIVTTSKPCEPEAQFITT